jgi:hypothetical protein
MLRFVARVLIARQHDLCCTALGGASDVVPKFVWPTDSAAQWIGAARSRHSSCSDNYPIDVKFGVVVDVEASRSIRQVEIGAARTSAAR